MQRRKLGVDLEVSALGLGCMGMSEFYGSRDDEESLRVLEQAIERGVDFLDTADMYGPYHNEELIGRLSHTDKQKVKIATKFGIVRQAGEYRRSIDNSPLYARQPKPFARLSNLRKNSTLCSRTNICHSSQGKAFREILLRCKRYIGNISLIFRFVIGG